jgi:hypothetical protein
MTIDCCLELLHARAAEMQAGIVEKLNKFVPVHSPILLMAVLRLLHNLSFDVAVRDELVAVGLVPKLVDIMHEPSGRYAPPPTVLMFS